MRRRQPPSENVVDQRFEQAKPTGSRVRRMIHHDKRWLRELGLIPYEIPQMAPLNTWVDPSGAPVPHRRYIELYEGMPRIPHDYEDPRG